MKTIYWLIAIICMIAFSFNAYPTNIVTWELIVDFGNDHAFKDTSDYLSLKKCEKRLEELKKDLKYDNVKLYCIKRG